MPSLHPVHFLRAMLVLIFVNCHLAPTVAGFVSLLVNVGGFRSWTPIPVSQTRKRLDWADIPISLSIGPSLGARHEWHCARWMSAHVL